MTEDFTEADMEIGRRRYALELTPREPNLMPLELMGDIWRAIGETAEEAGYRAFALEETGFGVVWFEKEDRV